MTAEEALFKDLIKELTARECPFIKRETLTWMRQVVKEGRETEPVFLFTSDDIPILADMWEYAFLVPAEKEYENDA